MSDPAQTEMVTVTIDGREIAVPKGTGMVEAALSAGIEIPVFCYEPRLGPPLGACRMCLCELEGVPKLQAACTLSAQDGMELRTAATSDQAKEGQEAILEFILLLHVIITQELLDELLPAEVEGKVLLESHGPFVTL